MPFNEKKGGSDSTDQTILKLCGKRTELDKKTRKKRKDECAFITIPDPIGLVKVKIRPRAW